MFSRMRPDNLKALQIAMRTSSSEYGGAIFILFSLSPSQTTPTTLVDNFHAISNPDYS
jgi:hypothetical protein